MTPILITEPPHVRADARGRDGGVREKLAAGVVLGSGGALSGANRKTCARSEPYRFLPQRSFGSIHSTCLSALVTDRAMEAWYNASIAEIAAEFVRLKVDVIFTNGTPPVLAAKQATSVIPIE
jgi:hypothetical protein